MRLGKIQDDHQPHAKEEKNITRASRWEETHAPGKNKLKFGG